MEKNELKKLIDTAAGRIPADMVIRNGKIADVYQGNFVEGDLAVSDGFIAGIGNYEGRTVVDAAGSWVLPGFIDTHIHIESSYVSPEEIGRLLVPHGGTTIISDPHEIVNVCGLAGLEYMLQASEETLLDIKLMLPSCVPVTAVEHSGAILDAKAMEAPIMDSRILGVGEFMDYPGVIQALDGVLDKILLAKKAGKIIDGHSPKVRDKELNAYASARIRTDHECATVEEMHQRISRGMYVMLRQGSACHDLRNLLKGVTPRNSRFCILCSDDRQPKTMLELGHLNDHLKICVEEGLDPMTAIQMATVNAAECYSLRDRGGIAPGLRADLALVDDLAKFRVNRVFIQGKLAAEGGKYLAPVKRRDDTAVRSSFHVKDFSAARLALPLRSDDVYVIDVRPGSVVTGKGRAAVRRSPSGCFVYDPALDIAKMTVVERHQNTGNVALGLIRGYGIKYGAIALSIAHDSHNIIAVGVSDADIALAVEKLLEQNGGICLVKDGKTAASMPMPLGGLMSDQSGEWVDEKLNVIHEAAFNELLINPAVEPVMTLCFMSLAVIPELKLTDMGLFDVGKFDFIPVEAEDCGAD
ncbi:MAG: adenine deaminase [Treponema sp.]|jgi:adenine deaminase|nr:adenine deaminase [Treponema sp.]